MRTSDSHPLQIAELACGSGRIGVTFCPGKQGDSLHGGAWARDLDLDMERIAAWGAATVVTLIEAPEFEMLKVPELGGAVRNHGMDWVHLPIRDLDTPSDRFERRWLWAGAALRARLAGGGRVLVHCRGGLGRAGTVAARLLIETGEVATASDAIARVRSVRPGAIETVSQEKYLERIGPISPDAEAWSAKVLGSLLGGALGDAFGYTVEFLKRDQILRRFGADGICEPVRQDGKLVVSDDTQMTLFTAEGLARSGGVGRGDDTVLEAVRRATLDWYRTQTEPYRKGLPGLLSHRALWVQRAPGGTCMSACAGGATGTPEGPVNNSKGCGGVMRVAPFGLQRGLRPGAAETLAARAAAQTHGHPTGYHASGVMAFLVRWLSDKGDLSGAVDAAIRRGQDTDPGKGETTDLLERARALVWDGTTEPFEAVTRLGEGWIAEEALAIGVCCAARGRDFRDTCRIAASHDGDSDSTASIAGQLFGAMHGVGALPGAWVQDLDLLDAVLDCAAALMSMPDAG